MIYVGRVGFICIVSKKMIWVLCRFNSISLQYNLSSVILDYPYIKCDTLDNRGRSNGERIKIIAVHETQPENDLRQKLFKEVLSAIFQNM